MSLQDKLDESLKYRLNLVVEIDGTFFSKKQVDTDTGDLIGTGSKIDTDKVGMISIVKLNPTQIDLTRIKTTINSTMITITDKNNVFSIFRGNSANGLIGSEIRIYLGVLKPLGVDFDFADYDKLNDYLIKDIDKTDGGYRIKAVAQTNLMKTPLFDVKGVLATAIDASATTIVANTDGDDFETSNFLKLEDEFMTYSAKSFAAGQTTFTGVVRAQLGSFATSHAIGIDVQQVTEVEENGVDILLQVLLSGSGTSIYDVLHDGLAIPDTKIDVAAIEKVRDDFFSTDPDFKLYFYDLADTLTFIEKHLLIPLNSRFVETLGGISIAALDQSVPGADLTDANDTNTQAKPRKWRSTQDRIQNRIVIRWDWEEGSQSFRKISTFNDTDSQADFGIRKPVKPLEFKGVLDSLGGGSIVTDRATRYLARFASPQVSVQTTSHLKTIADNPGDKVSATFGDLPQEGGSVGLSGEMEILNKAINLEDGTVRRTLVFTSYLNVRRGLIAPAPLIVSVISQKRFEVPASVITAYQLGYFLRLWNKTASTYFADPANEIVEIDTTLNEIEVANDFATTLTTAITIKFPEFDDNVSDEQKARYGFVGPVSGFFADGSKVYQIAI